MKALNAVQIVSNTITAYHYNNEEKSFEISNNDTVLRLIASKYKPMWYKQYQTLKAYALLNNYDNKLINSYIQFEFSSVNNLCIFKDSLHGNGKVDNLSFSINIYTRYK